MCNTALRLLTVCLTAIYLYRLSFVTHVTLKSGKIGGVEKKNYVGKREVENMCNMCICNNKKACSELNDKLEQALKECV